MGKRGNKSYIGSAKALDKEMNTWSITKANGDEDDKEELATVKLTPQGKDKDDVLVTLEITCSYLKNVYRRELGAGADRFTSPIQTYRQPVLCLKV